jgi:alanyl-tRNA synthetase
LIQPQFHFAFAASSGHHIADPILFSSQPQELYKFSVIPDRSLRMYDLEKIGISNRHLSFFENVVKGYVGASEKLPKEEACKELFDLFLHTHLDPNKLLITCLESVNVEGRKIESSETDIFYQTWKELVDQNNVKKTCGRRNFFYSRVIGNPGGIGCELYYQIGKSFVEIGSQVNYQFRFTGGLERTRNEAILQGFGLERLLMALEDKRKISDVSTVSPIKEVVKDYLRTNGEDEITISLYDESLVKIADSMRAILFIIYDCNQEIEKLNRSQRKILYDFRSILNSEKSELHYLGIYDQGIYDALTNIAVDLFKDRYSGMEKIKDYLLNFIKFKPNT